MEQSIVSGQNLPDFLAFVEEQQEKGHFTPVDYTEVVDEGDGSTADVTLLSILFTGAVQVVTTLVVAYFNQNRNSDLTLETTNDRGEKLVIHSKNMSADEIAKAVEAFRQAS